MADLSPVLALRRHPVVQRVVAVASAVASEVASELPLHLVGGMIRDAWLGRSTHDLDLVVAGRGEVLARRLATALEARFVPLGGKEFAAFRLVAEDFELDLWDREGMSLHQDLARRDLTVNAIALSLGAEPGRGRAGDAETSAETSRVVDPFDGLGDLERRLLRATTEASFAEDPLRVLRLPRFLSLMPEFRVEPGTRELARQAAPGLAGIAAERIREELRKLFEGPGAARAVCEMAALDLYPQLFLENGPDPGIGPGAGVADRMAQRVARELEALPHLEGRLRALARELGLTRGVTVNLATVRWACTVLQLGDPGLPGAEPDDPETVLRRLHDRGYLSRADSEPVLTLMRCRQPPDPDPQGASLRRRALHRLGDRWAEALVLWEARRAGETSEEPWEERVRGWLVLVRDEGDRVLDPPRLVSGDEVRARLGLGPGPEVGRVLDAVRWAQVEGRVRTRREALAEVARQGRTVESTPESSPGSTPGRERSP